jgi:cytochrome c peroxidase
MRLISPVPASLTVNAIFIILLLPITTGCSGGSDTVQATPTDDPDTNNTNDVDDVVATTIVKDGTAVETAALVSLGEKLFNDTSLSTPAGQGCVSCHDPTTGFTDPDSADPTSLGADGISIGTRNSPTASYAAHIPDSRTITRDDTLQEVRIGGQFLDGRAESLEAQAKAPFLNPAEMNNSSKSEVIDKIKTAPYAADFTALFGDTVLDDVDRAYDYIADAIAAFERTDLFSPFSSKFDQVAAGNAMFTMSEANGKLLFEGKGQCSVCHQTPGAGKQVFSNFEYFNIGVPANSELETDLGGAVNDAGLGATDIGTSRDDDGKFRTPNLRNVAITPPYMHNGVFTTLTEVVEFYNTRDDGFFAPPEIAVNVFEPENAAPDMGNLGLTAQEIADIVAFMETLTDQP